MSRAITVTIPGCPDAALSQNSRCHWRKRVSAVKQARRDTYYAALAYGVANLHNLPTFAGPVCVQATVAWGKGRKHMDAQNLIGALKSHLDGIEDAGIVANDKQIISIDVDQTRDPDGVGFVRLEVRELAPAVGAEPGGDA